MKEVVRDTPLQWFSDHPIVSAVLWILGHDMSKQKNRLEQYTPHSPNTGTKSPGLLSWKDDHGGNIAEYIQEVQSKTNTNSPQLTARSDTTDTSRHMKLNNSKGEQNVKKSEEGGLAECTPSPQWGFYIPITPPTDQDIFSKSSTLQVRAIKIKTPKSSQKAPIRYSENNTVVNMT